MEMGTKRLFRRELLPFVPAQRIFAIERIALLSVAHLRAEEFFSGILLAVNLKSRDKDMKNKEGLWKLSPSGLYGYTDCQSCFWVDNHGRSLSDFLIE